MKTATFIAAAAAILAADSAKPIGFGLLTTERKDLRIFINQPTAKRAKVKAARKQRRCK